MLSRFIRWLSRLLRTHWGRDLTTILADFLLAVILVTLLWAFTHFVEALGLADRHSDIIKELHFWYIVALLIVIPVKSIIAIWLRRSRRR